MIPSNGRPTCFLSKRITSAAARSTTAQNSPPRSAANASTRRGTFTSARGGSLQLTAVQVPSKSTELISPDHRIMVAQRVSAVSVAVVDAVLRFELVGLDMGVL